MSVSVYIIISYAACRMCMAKLDLMAVFVLLAYEKVSCQQPSELNVQCLVAGGGNSTVET